MKIYLSGSISGGREKLAAYIRIKEFLESRGHQVTSPQTADPSVTSKGEGDFNDSQTIFKRDIRQINGSNAMVAEVSLPSLGVGYEIAYALGRGMPILCLYDLEHPSHRISAMIAGNTFPLLTSAGYQESTLEALLEKWLSGWPDGFPSPD